jgi:uncharacterized protein involved in exopolysaccharide biosynthesis
MTNYFNNLDLLKILYKWKMLLMVLFITSLVASYIFTSSIFIKPKYKATAIMYPVNMSPFGNENTVEQALQIMQSDELQFKIIKKFHLIEHYDIDSTADYFQSKVLKELEDNTYVSKTEFESIEVKVMDTNPVLAVNIVNEYINLFNQKELSLKREKIDEVVKIIKNQFDKKKSEMDSLEMKLKDLRVRYGLLNYDAQTKVVSRNYYKSLSNHSSDLSKLTEMKKNLEEKGGEFISLSEHAYRTRAMYNDLQVQYETALKDLNKELTHSNIIMAPYPADKKSYPVRGMIVLIVVFSSMFFSLVLIYLFENAKINAEKPQLK